MHASNHTDAADRWKRRALGGCRTQPAAGRGTASAPPRSLFAGLRGLGTPRPYATIWDGPEPACTALQRHVLVKAAMRGGRAAAGAGRLPETRLGAARSGPADARQGNDNQVRETMVPRSDTPQYGRPKPTEAELAILQVLWRHGASTVADVQRALNEVRPTGYTTVLKLLQIMTEKGLVTRDESRRAHVYQPALTEAETQQQLVGDLLDRAFSGSASRLVLRALSARRASPAELAQIRQLLDEMEAEAPKGGAR